MVGNSGNNQLVDGDGGDTLTGAGGADVLYGGRGSDTIVINASNIAALATNTGNNTQVIARIDDGSGIDTLQLDGAGLLLDFSAISGPAIQNIEKIDLTGSGNNTLKLSLIDMLQSFDNSNVFNSSNTTSGLAAAADAQGQFAIDTTSGLTATVSKNQLMVDGDTGDNVVLTGFANWTTGTNVVATFGGVTHTYVAYNHNTSAQQLLIDQLVTVSAVL